MQRRHFLHAATAASAFGLSLPAFSESWPTRPVKLIVSFPAGSSPDLMARLLTEPLGHALGQPVIVDNKPGAGGNLGTGVVARAEPDGYNFLFTTQGPLVTAPLLFKNLNYDPMKDLTPITVVATAPNLLVARPALGVRTLSELISLARAKKGQLNYGSIGTGSATHLAMELLKERAGIDLLHVPYQGLPQVVNAILSGELDVAFTVPSNAMGHVRLGKLNALGVSTLTPATSMPGVPTLAEQGLPGFEAVSWQAILAPAKTPRSIVDRVNRELLKIIRSEDVRAKMQNQYFAASGTASEALTTLMKDERDRWARVIRTARVSVD